MKNKKGITWFFVLKAVLVILLLVFAGYLIHKMFKSTKELDTMCGPSSLNGRCACCFTDGMCPSDYHKSPYPSYTCPTDFEPCPKELCKDSDGWKKIREQDENSLGEGTCCLPNPR